MCNATCGSNDVGSAFGEGVRWCCCCAAVIGDMAFTNVSDVVNGAAADGAAVNPLLVTTIPLAAVEAQLPLLASNPMGVPGATDESGGDVGDIPPRTEDATADVEYGEPAMLQGDLLAFELGATAAVVEDEAVDDEDEVDEVIDELEDEDDDDDDEEEQAAPAVVAVEPVPRMPVMGVGVRCCCCNAGVIGRQPFGEIDNKCVTVGVVDGGGVPPGLGVPFVVRLTVAEMLPLKWCTLASTKALELIVGSRLMTIPPPALVVLPSEAAVMAASHGRTVPSMVGALSALRLLGWLSVSSQPSAMSIKHFGKTADREENIYI